MASERELRSNSDGASIDCSPPSVTVGESSSICGCSPLAGYAIALTTSSQHHSVDPQDTLGNPPAYSESEINIEAPAAVPLQDHTPEPQSWTGTQLSRLWGSVKRYWKLQQEIERASEHADQSTKYISKLRFQDGLPGHTSVIAVFPSERSFRSWEERSCFPRGHFLLNGGNIETMYLPSYDETQLYDLIQTIVFPNGPQLRRQPWGYNMKVTLPQYRLCLIESNAMAEKITIEVHYAFVDENDVPTAAAGDDSASTDTALPGFNAVKTEDVILNTVFPKAHRHTRRNGAGKRVEVTRPVKRFHQIERKGLVDVLTITVCYE